MGREPLLGRVSPFLPSAGAEESVPGISTTFAVLSRCLGQVAHVLLTRPPLIPDPKARNPFDLHVLSTPPAFVLSQDQTLTYIGSSLLAPLLSYVRSQGPCCSVFKDRVGRNRSAAARRQRLLYCAPHRHATGIFWSTAGHPPPRHPAPPGAASSESGAAQADSVAGSCRI